MSRWTEEMDRLCDTACPHHSASAGVCPRCLAAALERAYREGLEAARRMALKFEPCGECLTRDQLLDEMLWRFALTARRTVGAVVTMPEDDPEDDREDLDV